MQTGAAHHLTDLRMASQAHAAMTALWTLTGLNALFIGGLLWLALRLARMESLVVVCAWSRTIEYGGQWISFEDYLERRFKISVSHGISPAEAQKVYNAGVQIDQPSSSASIN